MREVLSQKFFERDTFEVAKELLGKFLVRRFYGKETSLMITEVEVYDGYEDKASHAYRGKTKRNKNMFGDAGLWYVYLVYGMYEMLNVVTRENGYPAAILIRGTLEVVGPGRITKYLNITGKLNGKKVDKKVRMIVIPSSPAIYSRAMKNGLLEILIDAGAIISPPTCGPCLGGHMGILADGEKALTTTNRNFVGRMGSTKSEIYLAGPAVAAATAVTGKISSPEEIV